MCMPVEITNTNMLQTTGLHIAITHMSTVHLGRLLHLVHFQEELDLVVDRIVLED